MSTRIPSPDRWATSPRTLSAMLVLSAIVGCGGDIDPPYRINTLRVMTVRSSQPYARPGETITLTALAYDPRGRTIRWAWLPCPEPWLTDFRSCVEELPAPEAYRRWIQFTDQPTVTFAIPNVPFTEPKAGKISPLWYSVMGFACAGEIRVVDEIHPVTGPFRCVGPAGEPLGSDSYVPGVKGLGIHPDLRNANPVLGGLTRPDGAWPDDLVPTVDGCPNANRENGGCPFSSVQRISIQVAEESFEEGPDFVGDVDEEVVDVQVYVSEGKLGAESHRFERGDPPKLTDWWPLRTGTAHDAHVWIVASDRRGGQTWTQRTVHVR